VGSNPTPRILGEILRMNHRRPGLSIPPQDRSSSTVNYPSLEGGIFRPKPPK